MYIPEKPWLGFALQYTSTQKYLSKFKFRKYLNVSMKNKKTAVNLK